MFSLRSNQSTARSREVGRHLTFNIQDLEGEISVLVAGHYTLSLLIIPQNNQNEKQHNKPQTLRNLNPKVQEAIRTQKKTNQAELAPTDLHIKQHTNDDKKL